MALSIFVLKQKVPSVLENISHVIVAETKDKAIEMANELSVTEGEIWGNEQLCTCEEIGASYLLFPEVVLTSYQQCHKT